jgi:DNA-binding transcriptional MocR family regulator
MSLRSSEISDLLGWWDREDGPLYRRLANGLRRLAEEGYLVDGSPLPPERQLAEALAVSRTTVTAAYASLRTEGWIEARQGSATRVAVSRTSEAAVHRADGLMATMLRGLGEATIDLTVAAPGAAPVVTRAFSDPGSFLEDTGALTRGHGYHAAGHPQLRQAVADRLSDEGLPTETDQVLITNGAQQAIALLFTELIRPGMGIALEEVTYPGAIDLAQRSGAPLHFLPLGPDGVDLTALQAVGREKRVGVVFLVADFQNPTGVVMPVEARRRLVELSHEAEAFVIDDRTNTDLDLGSAPPPPLASFDDQSRVVTIGGMSKLYWGGLRIGWIRARPSLIDHLIARKSSTDLGSACPTQLMASELLAHHHGATHRWRNTQLNLSLDALGAALTGQWPEAEWERPAGGPNLWIRLPETDALEFSRRALDQEVAVIAGPLLSGRPGRATDRIRIPFYADPDVLTEAVGRLAHCWRQMVRR